MPCGSIRFCCGVKESNTIVETFFGLVAAGRIRFMAMEEAIKKAYELAVRTKTTIYNSTFVVLAGELGAELKTLDKKQAEIFESYSR